MVRNSLMLIIHFPTSSGVSDWVIQQMTWVELASDASSAKQVNDCAVRLKERMDEGLAQYLSLDSSLFFTTVLPFLPFSVISLLPDYSFFTPFITILLHSFNFLLFSLVSLLSLDLCKFAFSIHIFPHQSPTFFVNFSMRYFHLLIRGCVRPSICFSVSLSVAD